MEVTTKVPFGEFLMRTAKELRSYLPDSDNVEVHIDSIPVLNGQEIIGAKIVNTEREYVTAIGLEAFYEDYYTDPQATVEGILKKIAEVVQGNAAPSFEEAKDNIIPLLISEKGNESFLSECPQRPFLDLVVYYGVFTVVNDDPFSREFSLLCVTDKVMGDWGINEKELDAIAMANLPKVLPERILGGELMTVVTSTYYKYGASLLLSEGVMQLLAEFVGEDEFYILPSSVHDFIAVPLYLDIRELGQGVQNVNAAPYVSGIGIKLSDKVYKYSLKDGLTIAYDPAETEAA